MARFLRFAFGVLIALATLSAQELPEPEAADSFEIEPGLLIPNRASDEPLSESSADDPAPTELTVARLEMEFDRAKKAAAAGERLFKTGVLAKVEAEERALKVMRVAAQLAAAQVERARQEIASMQSRFDAGQIRKEELAMAAAELAQAEGKALAAAEARDRAELEAAQLNLRRQQKLLAAGSGRKSDVHRAEERLAKLNQPRDAP